MIEIVTVLGLASTLGNVEGGLLGSLISVLDWMDNAHNEHKRSGEMNDLVWLRTCVIFQQYDCQQNNQEHQL